MAEGGSYPDETELQRIVEELNELRKVQLRTSYDFASSPAILWHLGRGNVEVAAAFFRELARAEDRRIRAAIASLGAQPTRVNIEDRMNDFALAENVKSTRTIRRWTEEGFQIIAELILGWSSEEGHDRPLVEVQFAPHGPNAVVIRMTGVARPGRGQVVPPEVRSSGGPLVRLDEDADAPAPASADHFVLRALAEFSAHDTEYSLVMRWLGNPDAYFEVEVLPGVMPGRSLFVITTVRGCDVRWERPVE